MSEKKDRLDEIKRLADSVNEREKQTFEVNARPLAWELIGMVRAERERADKADIDRLIMKGEYDSVLARADSAEARLKEVERERDEWKWKCSEVWSARYKEGLEMAAAKMDIGYTSEELRTEAARAALENKNPDPE